MINYFQKKGVITTYIIIFGALFLLLLGGLFGFTLIQLKQTSQEAAWNKALERIASPIEITKELKAKGSQEAKESVEKRLGLRAS